MNNRHSSFPVDGTPRASARGPWPWLLGAGPALVVVASLATGWIALTRGDRVVADDYYKVGLSINRRLGAMPAPLPVPGATLTVGAAGDVHVRLSDSTPLPAQLRLTVSRPGDARASRPLMLARAADDEFVGVLRDVSNGRRIVTLASEAWTLPVTVVDHWPATLTLRAAASPS
jgi:uncharacterized protein